MSTTPETQLRARLSEFILELIIFPDLDLTEDTSLLQSGLLDSSAIVQLAQWIQSEVGADVDLLQFDLTGEWETIASIERFIQRQRHNQAG